MSNPYRKQNEVLSCYPLRAHPAWIGGVAVSALGLLFMSLRLVEYLDQPMIWGILALTALVPPIVANRIAHFRVAGGRGELRVFRDRVEVPHAARRDPLILSMAGLSVEVRAVLQSAVNGVRIEEPASLVLRHPDGTRELSAELFGSGEALERAALDIRRVQQGLNVEEPQVPELAERGERDKRAKRDKYDDRLDEELERLD